MRKALRVKLVIVMAAAIVLAEPSPVSATEVGPGYDIEMSRMIPMRDGVELESWLFKPSNLRAKAPTVLSLTQYEIDVVPHGRYFTQRGHVYIQV